MTGHTPYHGRRSRANASRKSADPQSVGILLIPRPIPLSSPPSVASQAADAKGCRHVLDELPELQRSCMSGAHSQLCASHRVWACFASQLDGRISQFTDVTIASTPCRATQLCLELTSHRHLQNSLSTQGLVEQDNMYSPRCKGTKQGSSTHQGSHKTQEQTFSLSG